jgi:hypothetical protein
MSIERDWAQDGGMFLPEVPEGFILNEELNELSASGEFEHFFSVNFPNVPEDFIPDKEKARDRLIGKVMLGASLTGIAVSLGLLSVCIH